MKCPCMGCTKREIGCHGSCTNYQDWHEEQKKEKIYNLQMSTFRTYSRGKAKSLRKYSDKGRSAAEM